MKLSKKSLIYIDTGHNYPGVDTGAIGFKREDVLVADISKHLKELCKVNGQNFIEKRSDRIKSLGQSLNSRCTTANNLNADLFISIHANAFHKNESARGVETFVYDLQTSKCLKIAKSIQSEMVSLGYLDRGLKEQPGLAVLRKTNMPAILVECGFVTNSEDMQRFSSKAFANAIYTGITSNYSTKDKKEAIELTPPQEVTLYQGTLRINNDTVGKPTTDDITEFKKDYLYNLPKGDYNYVTVLAEEENHYLILIPTLKNFKTEKNYQRQYHWVDIQYCTFL